MAQIAQLWIGNTDCFENEEQLNNVVRTKTGVNPKACWFSRNRATGQLNGFGFLDFYTTQDAADVLRQLRDTPIPNYPGIRFHLNWGNNLKPKGNIETIQQSTGYSAYVGNLPITMDDEKMLDFFKSYFPRLITARMIRGPDGVSKGFGFVRFNTYAEMTDFINKFNNYTEFGRPLRVSEAAANRKTAPTEASTDSENSILFIRDLDPEIVNEEVLENSFMQYGRVVRIKFIPSHPDWANVEMENHFEAEAARTALQGTRFGGTTKSDIQFGRWIDEAAPTTFVKRLTVPVIKPPKINKKLQSQFFSDEGVARVIDTMELFSLYQRATPLAMVDTAVANRCAADRRLNVETRLFS